MDFSGRDDSLYWDVLTCLILTVDKRLRWREIRNTIHEKYEKIYDKETFEVMLNRVLKRLLQSGHVKKESKGHQQVYYFIPKKRQKEISEELDRRFAHEKLDEIWDVLTTEQRKKSVENLALQSRLIIQSGKAFVKNFALSMKDLIGVWVTELERPSRSVEEKYSPEKRQGFLRELGSLQEQLIRIETGMTEEDKFLKEKYEQMIKLSLEFTNKVVDPCYNGRYNEAIEDLMRKAIEEQNKKLCPRESSSQ